MDSSHDIYWVQVAVPAVSGLLGVLLGGWITTHSQRIERQQARIREQLSGFYSVLLGMRSQIRAKSDVRVKIRNIAQKIQQDEIRQAMRCSPSFGPIFSLLKVDRCLQYSIDRSLLLGLWEL